MAINKFTTNTAPRTIKYEKSGCLEATSCNYCQGKIISNNYCRKPVNGLQTFIEGESIEIFGKVACIQCKFKWGNAEDYMNRCKEHSNVWVHAVLR